MTQTHTPFDSDKYKTTTRAQWQEAAAAWHAWGPALRRWLGPATIEMLDMARIAPGHRVLDVAAGAGDQTLQIAERVGPSGRVLATDIAPRILEFARDAAAAAGLTNVEVRAMDGEQLDLPDAAFDAVVSRVGLIYFPDQNKAMSEMVRVVVPGGRVAAIVYSTADKNGFFSDPVGIIRRRANLGPPVPGQPGPFSLGQPSALRALFERAGLRDVDVRAVSAPVRMDRAADCVRFERESFGALHQMLSGLSEAERTAAWEEIAQALARYEGPAGFEGPCELLIAVGTR